MSAGPDGKSPPTPSAGGPQIGFGPPRIGPLVKKRPHRRSPQACDECRLRKRACDAVDPCSPCRRSGLNCTYQFRRPVPPPTLRIRDLQDHLRLARGWLQQVKDKAPAVPGLDLDECLRTLDFTLPDPTEATSPSTPQSVSATPGATPTKTPLDQQLGSASSWGREKHENMLTGFGRFAASKPDDTYYQGAFSDVSFILRTIELFREGPQTSYEAEFDKIRAFFTLPFTGEIKEADVLTNGAVESLEAALSTPHLMLSFLDGQSLRHSISHPVSSRPAPFYAVLQLTLALARLSDVGKHQMDGCGEAWDSAYAHFVSGMKLLLPIEKDSLSSLQALLCAALYLLATSRFTAAHSLIGTACSSAARLGLLTKSIVVSQLSPEERTNRARALSTLMTLDMLTSLILDLPLALHGDAVSESRITELAAEAQQQGDLRTAAMLRQVCLLMIPISIRNRTQREVATSSESDRNLDVDDIRLLETAHSDFRRWKRDVSPLLTSLGSNKEHNVIKKDLEMIYNFSQIIIFRSHLHHLRSVAVGGSMSKMQSYHALACLKLATSTIAHADRQADGPQSHLLTTSWLATYTIFSAVMCLVFLIAAHPGTARPSVAWQRGYKGIRILATYKCGSNLAAACLEVLKIVTTELSHTVYFDYDEIENAVTRVCDGHGPAGGASHKSSFDIAAGQAGMTDLVENAADRMLIQAEALTAEFDLRDILHLSDSD